MGKKKEINEDWLLTNGVIGLGEKLGYPEVVEEYRLHYIRQYGERHQRFVGTYSWLKNCVNDEIIYRVFCIQDFGERASNRKVFEVMRISADGCVCRNMFFQQLAGWKCEFPGTKSTSWYYGYGSEFKERCWENAEFMKDAGIDIQTLGTCDLEDYLKAKYPYLLKKCPQILICNYKHFFKILKNYRESTSIEGLLLLNLPRIAEDQRINKLSKEKKSEIVKYIQTVPEEDRETVNQIGLSGVLKCLKQNLTITQYKLVVSNRVNTWKDYLYYKKMGIAKEDCNHCLLDHYEDYLKMAKNNGHDISQDYWKYPKDINKAHDRMMEECKYIESCENNAKYSSGMKEIYESLNKSIEFSNGKYRIYIPTNYEDIQKQCDALYQCLIRNGYVEEYIDKKKLLVFIRDMKDNPIATAEVFWDKKVGQFYADERDRDNCIPTKELQDFLYSWLDKIKLFKPKAEKKPHFFKGFAVDTKSGKLTSIAGGLNNMTYEIGKIYDTGVPDNEFNEKCKSSKKAIHFCNNIRKVASFVNYTKIAEIEVLGKLCNTGDEYYSNKIRVVRVIDNYANA